MASWWIEDGIFVDEERKALEAEIVRQEMQVHRFSREQPPELPADGVPRCSVETALQIAARGGGPARFCAIDAFDVRRYAEALGAELLNRAHRIVPLGELVARKAELFAELSVEGRLFLRPPECDKRFDGDISTDKYFESDVKMIRECGLAPSDLVVVARPVELIGEWRLVVVEDEAVAGSDYTLHATARRPEFATPPEEVFVYGETMAARLGEPAPAWVIDVARLEGDVLRVIEIGPFACADLYGCDVEEVVDAVSDVA